LPPAYPLSIATVESVNRVAIPVEKWQTLLRSTQGRIQFAVSLFLLYEYWFTTEHFSRTALSWTAWKLSEKM
jgi:hypothetical protein